MAKNVIKVSFQAVMGDFNKTVRENLNNTKNNNIKQMSQNSINTTLVNMVKNLNKNINQAMKNFLSNLKEASKQAKILVDKFRFKKAIDDLKALKKSFSDLIRMSANVKIAPASNSSKKNTSSKEVPQNNKSSGDFSQLRTQLLNFKTRASTVFNAISTKFRNSIISSVSRINNSIKTVDSMVREVSKNNKSSDNFSQLRTQLLNFKNMASNVFNTISNNFGNAIKNKLSEIKNTTSNIFTSISNNLKNSITSAFTRINNSIKEIGLRIREVSSQFRFNRAIDDTNSIKNHLYSIKGIIARIFTIFEDKKILDFTVGKAMEEETALIQYELLLKSKEKAIERIAEIKQMGALTPYENEELIQTDKLLESFKIRTKDLLTLVGDVASRLENPKEKIVEIARYLGQISSGQYGEAIDRFEEFDITNRDILKNDYGLKFDKDGSYQGDKASIMKAVLQEMYKADGSMEKLSNTGAGKLSTMMDNINEVGKSIGKGALDSAKGSIDAVISALDRANKNGSLNRLTTTLGDALSFIFDNFTKFISNLDVWIVKIEEFIQKVIDNSDKIKEAFMGIVTTIFFLESGKTVLGTITNTLDSLGGAIENIGTIGEVVAKIGAKFSQSTRLVGIFRGAITAFKSPIVLAILAVVGAIVLMIKYWDNVKVVVFSVFSFIVKCVGMFFKFFTDGTSKLIDDFLSLVDKIPLLGDAFKALLSPIKDALDNITDTIDKKISYTEKLVENAKKDNSKDKNKNTENNKDTTNDEIEKLKQQLEEEKKNNEIDFSKYVIPTGGNTSNETNNKKKEITIDDKINDINDIYQPDIDKFESRAELSEKQDKQKEVKENKNHALYLMQEQAKQLLNLQNKSSGRDKSIVEVARNRLLSRIYDLIDEIKGGMDKIVGEFNKPSDLSAITKYQYDTSISNNLSNKKIVYSPNINMQLTIKDIKEKGIQDVNDFITDLLAKNKDSIVKYGMLDITRN